MLEFCPLCDKNGYKRKVALSQINLEEAVWLCESSECPWPFGYQDFTFVSRRVGETWSSEWESRKPAAPKPCEPFPISLNELGLDTPPVTPGSGSEVVHKDSVFGDNTCLVTSLSLSTSSIILSKGNLVSKNSSSKPRESYASECGSIDSVGTRVSGEIETLTSSIRSSDGDSKSQELLNNVSHSIRNNESGSFSLSGDANLEGLDKCLSSSQRFVKVCDAAEALTESVFNPGKSLRDRISFKATETLDNFCENANHESTDKCKKWLSDNTKSTVLRDHSYSSPESKQVAVQPASVSLQDLDSKSQKDSASGFRNTTHLPRVKSIARTNVKLAGATSALNRESSHKLPVARIVVNLPRKNNCNLISGDLNTSKIDAKAEVIDGLSPINIYYDITNVVEKCVTVPWRTGSIDKVKEEKKESTGPEPVVNNSDVSINMEVETADCRQNKSGQSTTSSNTETQRQSMKKLLKRTIPKLTKYQGFNFGNLKKKSKAEVTHSEENVKSSLSNLPSPDNISVCSDATWTSDVSCPATFNIDSKSEPLSSSVGSDSKSALHAGNCSPTISNSDSKISNILSPESDRVLESNLNLDLALDELMLGNGQDLPQGFEDDWLVSLLE